MPIRRRALEGFRATDIGVEELRWLWVAAAVAADMWDDESWHLLASRHVEVARETGALGELALGLNSRIVVHVFAGELDAAASLVEEARTVANVIGSDLAPYGALGLVAWQGREGETDALAEASMSDVAARGEGIAITVTQWAKAVLLNGLGRHEDALLAAGQAAEHPHELSAPNWALAELVEAAARTGRTEVATEALERLTEMTRAAATDWALGASVAPARSSARGMPRTSSIARRSRGSGGQASGRSSPARICSTGSGCGTKGARSRHAAACARPSTCARTWGPRRSRIVLVVRC